LIWSSIYSSHRALVLFNRRCRAMWGGRERTMDEEKTREKKKKREKKANLRR
jgi:hypothetical protein